MFHQAAIASVPRSVADPFPTNDANITGTLNLLWESKETGVKRVVFASSSSVYGSDPTLPKNEDLLGLVLSPYALSKKAGEDYLRIFYELYGLETVSLRYFNIFGPRQNPQSQYAAVIPKFVTSMLQGKSPAVYGDGTQSRDFTYVANVVKANMLAMSSSKAAGDVFNIGAGGQVSILEVIKILNKKMGKDIKPKFLPPRKGDPLHSSADISKSQKLLGYHPFVSFEEGMEKVIEYYKKLTV